MLCSFLGSRSERLTQGSAVGSAVPGGGPRSFRVPATVGTILRAPHVSQEDPSLPSILPPWPLGLWVRRHSSRRHCHLAHPSLVLALASCPCDWPWLCLANCACPGPQTAMSGLASRSHRTASTEPSPPLLRAVLRGLAPGSEPVSDTCHMCDFGETTWHP